MSYRNQNRDIQVAYYDEMCTHFDYEEVREILDQKRVEDITDIIYTDNGANIQGMKEALDAITGLSDSPDILEKFIKDKGVATNETSEREDCVCAEGYNFDLNKFSLFLTTLRNPATEENVIREIICRVSAATFEGKAKLSLGQMCEILLFGVLFTYIQKVPEDAEFCTLQKFLNLEDTMAIQTLLQRKKNLDVRKPVVEFPCYKGLKEEKMLQLELALIRNMLDEPVLITLENSPLRRYLEPKEQILALIEKGNVVTFLPRIGMSKDWIVYQDGRSLEARKNGAITKLPLGSDELVLFSESERYGFMIAERTGEFQNERFKGISPDNGICFLKGDLQNYGFLFPDGSYQGHEAYTNWNSILFFDLGGGNGIAVTADRSAIDRNGKRLCDQVAAVSCCGERYIFLRMDGSVVTNQGRLSDIPTPARAVCADAHGCWISTDESLFYWDGNRTRNMCSLKELPLDEIEKDNSGEFVSGRFVDNKVERLR